VAKTSIEWATDTWNPVRARRTSDGKAGWHCEKISAGCAHCYAETFNGRRLPGGGTGLAYTKHSRVAAETYLDEPVLRQPLSWRKPRRAFVCSMTDLFGEWVPDEQIDRVFAVMALAQQHTFMVLTKRAERMREYLSRTRGPENVLSRVLRAARDIPKPRGCTVPDTLGWPYPKVWLGVSVEDQAAADERVPHLLQTPAAVRFLSVEPLLGSVELRDREYDITWLSRQSLNGQTRPTLDWVIVGGESGPGARPCYVEHVRSVVEQCRAAGVACFVKQLGARCYSMPYRGSDRKWTPEEALDSNGEEIEELGKILGASRSLVLKSPKGGDPLEWPEDLRVREMPA
jgi:protein gp37